MTINGDAWDVVSDLVWNAVTVVRETLKGQTAVEGFSEMPTQGFIGATLRDRPDYPVQNFNQMTNVEVIVLQANGKQIYGAGMWNTEVGEVRTQEGTFTVRFEGPQVTEQTIG
jgi:hypothetical protein